jgi:hypothetical protein
MNRKWKHYAKTDEDFLKYWGDKEFRKITA